MGCLKSERNILGDMLTKMERVRFCSVFFLQIEKNEIVSQFKKMKICTFEYEPLSVCFFHKGLLSQFGLFSN